MALGGYLYAQATVGPYSTTDYPTCRSWALAVHKARCEAFLKATARETTGAWTRVQTSLYNEFSDTAGTFDIYVQDIHPVTVDTGSNWPSFVSFFTNGTAEYCIITSRGFNFNSSWKTINASNIQYGTYINFNNASGSGANESYKSSGYNMMHAFSLNGFAGYDVAESVMCSGIDTTPIVPCYTKMNAHYTQNIGVSSASNDYLVSITSGSAFSQAEFEFTFGYAVKGTQIECFLKRSDRSRLMWSIIGEIIGETASEDEDTHKTGSFIDKYYSGNECDTNENLGRYSTSKEEIGICCMKTNGYVYSENATYMEPIRPSNQCITVGRVTTATAENLGWSACPVCFYLTNMTISAFTGIDGDGNGMKGFIDTDLLRLVSATQTQVFGATYGDGNFIAMFTSNTQPNGYILGWDPSNPSLV